MEVDPEVCKILLEYQNQIENFIMATQDKKYYFAPIGCSCINQFQLDFKFGRSGKIKIGL